MTLISTDHSRHKIIGAAPRNQRLKTYPSALRRVLALLCLFATTAYAGDFQLLDRATAHALGSAANHKQPTLLLLWSYDCPHCKKNMRQIASLARQHPSLQVISVATDPPSTALRQRLEATGLPGRRYAYGPDAPEALAYALDPDWHGELPRTLIFDGKGGRVAHSGVQGSALLLQNLGLK